MNENIIAWNVTNWVTVLIIGVTGFFAIGAAQKWYQSRQG